MDPFIGMIIMFAGNFAPRGWALCDGQLLPISANQALFSILGTTYGGDGRTTFQLPNLQSRVPMHAGRGPGLSPRPLGSMGGTESETLSIGQMPMHNHLVHAANQGGDDSNPLTGQAFGTDGDDLYLEASQSTAMPSGVITNNGGSQPHNNVQPFQCVNFIIALVGIYPSRS